MKQLSMVIIMLFFPVNTFDKSVLLVWCMLLRSVLLTKRTSIRIPKP